MRNNTIRDLAIIFVLCPMVLLAGLNVNGDTGIWLDQNFRTSLSKNWIVNLQMQQRWGNDCKTFYDQQYEADFQYILVSPHEDSCLKLVTAGGGYNATRDLKTPPGDRQKFVWSSRYILSAQATWAFNKWELIQRLRTEYTVPHHKGFYKHEVIRFRARFNAPWSWTCYKLNPWVSNEWFFRENSRNLLTGKGLVGNWYQNRVRIGLGATLVEDEWSCSIYLQCRSLRQPSGSKRAWNNIYQLGFTLQYDL